MFLAFRVVLLGLERPLGKKAVTGASTAAGGFIFFGAAAVALLPTLIIYSFFHRPQSWDFLGYAFLTASLFMVPFTFYIMALQHGEVSVITPLYSFGTLLVFGLPIIFQGEPFTWIRFAGAMLVFLGVFFLKPGVNPLQSLRNVAVDRGAQFILLNTTLIAIIRLIDNRMADIEPIHYALSCAILNGVFFGIAVLFLRKWREVMAVYRQRTRLVWANGVVNGYAYVSLLAVLGFGLDLSVAEPVGNTSMLLAVALGYFMFGEKIQARLIASALMIVGVFLLALG
jgi:drug/metabolite transporter (DMT)-like permease